MQGQGRGRGRDRGKTIAMNEYVPPATTRMPFMGGEALTQAAHHRTTMHVGLDTEQINRIERASFIGGVDVGSSCKSNAHGGCCNEFSSRALWFSLFAPSLSTRDAMQFPN